MLILRTVPFTLCASLLWYFMPRERVKGAIAAPLTIPAGARVEREAAASLPCTFTGSVVSEKQ
ncbi:hypothetical protein CJP72_15785 [Citrobacter sp. NCU1]|nr:hypothetical protein [Citrobacter sp. NCU1]